MPYAQFVFYLKVKGVAGTNFHNATGNDDDIRYHKSIADFFIDFSINRIFNIDICVHFTHNSNTSQLLLLQSGLVP